MDSGRAWPRCDPPSPAGPPQGRAAGRGRILPGAVAAAALFAFGGLPAHAERGGSSVELQELRPSEAHGQSAKAVVQIMQRHHYRKAPLDDDLGGRILDRYLDGFDPARSVFLASDIAEFDAYRTQVDDALRRGRLGFAFHVFKRYRQRTADRAATAAALLGQGFDFAREEALEIDRTDAPWAQTPEELDDHWRQRVKNDILELELAGHEPSAIPQALRTRYARMDRRVRQIDADDVVQYFLNAYTQSIDPHSTYFSPRTSENFQIRMSLSLEGIGAALQTVGEHTVVRRVLPGGPADRSGQLRVDDRIIGVRQSGEDEVTDIVSWRLEDVVDLIRGPKGSTVHLQVQPADAPSGVPRMVSMVRARIDLDDQSASRRILETQASDGRRAHVGVIKIPSFYLDMAGRSTGRSDYRSASRDVRRLVAELRADAVDGLIVDLRDNQGGSLDEALLVAGLFIESGPIVQVRRSSGQARLRWDEDSSIAWDGPLGVLVNRGSASASEIFAGAIQDYGRGLVIGTRTYGKGTVQNLIDLPSYGGTGRLKLTIAQYFRVNGEGVQRFGIVPDVDLAAVAGEEQGGERDLETALPWARVGAARWQAQERSEEVLAQVRTRSRERLDGEAPYRLLREEIEARRRQRENGSLSLHRDRRRETHTAAEAERRRLLQAIGEAAAVDDDGPEAAAASGGFMTLRDELLMKEAARVIADFIAYRTHPERSLVRN